MNQFEQLKKDGNLLGKPVRPKKPKKGLRRASPKRAQQMKEYLKLRKEFLRAHPWCMIWLKRNGFNGTDIRDVDAAAVGGVRILTINGSFAFIPMREVPRSQDIHHTKGRTGNNFLDTSTWLAASRKEHRWCHDHPREARQLGLLQ